jgi:DNA repair protein SbcC/Rad50
LKIDKVVIKNFRNYFGEHEFILSKQTTIIYGPNGFGKSSFFDAIEWCLTGTIGRYRKNEFRPRDVLNHRVDNTDDECFVRIEFDGNKLIRGFKIRDGQMGNIKVKIITSNNNEIEGKDNVENFLKNQYFDGSKNNSDHFSSLIKQSHILSQDQVTDFILKDSPKERFDSLADIMGMKNVLYLFENFKEVLKQIRKKADTHQENIRKYDEFIQYRKKDLIPIDYNKIKKILNQFKLRADLESSFDKLRAIKEESIKKLNYVNNDLKVIYNIKNLHFNSLIEVEKKLNELSEKKSSLEVQIEKLQHLNERISKLKHNLGEEKSKFEEINQLNEMVKSKKSLLSRIGIDKEIHLDFINERIKITREKLSTLEYREKYIEDYRKLIHKIAEIPKKSKITSDRLIFLQKRWTRINNVLERIENLITNSEKGVLTKLLEHIKGINEIVEFNNEGKCPVCSAYHGDRLLDNIRDNIHFYELRVKESIESASRLLEIKKRFEQKKEKTLKEIKSLEKQKDELAISLSQAQYQLKVIESGEYYKSDLFKNIFDSSTKEEIEKVRRELLDLEKAYFIQIEIQKLQRRIEGLKRMLGVNKILNLEDYSKRIQRLTRAESRIQRYIEKKENLKTYVNTLYNNIYKQLAALQFVHMHHDLNSNVEEIINSLEKEKESLNHKINIISEFLNLEQSINLNKKVMEDIDQYIKKKNVELEKLKECNQALEQIENFVSSIKRVLGAKAKDFLNTDQSLIQKYYRYLNPLSSTSPVRFEGENGELNIMLPVNESGTEKQQLVNAKHTLSSGQLNVLAIAIFLAINESQKVSKLDFVAIDDPIQNMDDVNRFSICDILGSLQKQLIISTHDIEFVKLFLKKNEGRDHEVKVYILESPFLDSEKVKSLTF